LVTGMSARGAELREPTQTGVDAVTERRPKRTIAHVTSRFPKISETFILDEILELQRLGFGVEVFALVRERPSVMHPHAEALLPQVHFGTPVTGEAVAAQLYWLRRRPRRYLSAWWGCLRGNIRSPRFLCRAVVAVPVAAAFARDMERLAVEHVHAHYATHPALVAWVVQRLTDLPYSFTVHAHDVYVDRAMLREKLERATFVAAVSEFNQRLLERLEPARARGKVFVVRTGVEPRIFHARPRPPNGRLRVVCVASLEPYKGHSYLVEACARARAAGLELECVLVGEGPERRTIERLVAMRGLSDTVQLIGARPRSEVSELVATADLLVLPSIVMPNGKMEGLPVVLMEAMAAGTPVVASAISGVPELVEDGVTGLLVTERDAPALARAITRLAGDADLRRQLAAAARERVLEDYDRRVTTRRLAELLLGNRSPA
jgi:colanic acid/amylovoran biosynthesis glycosyltransferase